MAYRAETVSEGFPDRAGLIAGGARPARDFPLLARAYLEGTLKLDELISRRIPLDEINDGFAALERGETIRSVVVF